MSRSVANMVQTSDGAGYSLQLYTRKPGKKTLERAALTIPVSYQREAWDFAIRKDGMLFATVVGAWKLTQVDPGGRGMEQSGRCTYAVCRMGDDWKIVAQHYSLQPTEGAVTE